ncbi:MAG: hypothetical protein QXF26_09220 [Candidatus Bathyarchaeia archaeon]
MTAPLGLEEAIRQLVQGVALIGNAINYFVRFILSLVGVDVPDLYLRIATIIIIVLALWKFSGAVSKVVVFALILLLISTAAGIGMQFLGE